MESLKKAKRLYVLQQTSDEIFDMMVRYNPRKFNKADGVFYSGHKKIKYDPPYRGKGYHDVLGSLALFKDDEQFVDADAGRKAASYRANRSKFNGHAIRLNGFNDDSQVKPGPSPEPIRLNRSQRWLESESYPSARSLSPSNFKVV